MVHFQATPASYSCSKLHIFKFQLAWAVASDFKDFKHLRIVCAILFCCLQENTVLTIYVWAKTFSTALVSLAKKSRECPDWIKVWVSVNKLKSLWLSFQGLLEHSLLLLESDSENENCRGLWDCDDQAISLPASRVCV